MRKLGVIILFMAVVVTTLVAPMTITKKVVNVAVPSIQMTAAATTSMIPITVPVVTTSVSQAGDVCDPSLGLHPGLKLSCFLQWLMDVFDASDGLPF